MVQIVPFLYPKEGRIFCQIIAAFIAAFVVVQSAMNMIDHARYGFLNGRHQTGCHIVLFSCPILR